MYFRPQNWHEACRIGRFIGWWRINFSKSSDISMDIYMCVCVMTFSTKLTTGMLWVIIYHIHALSTVEKYKQIVWIKNGWRRSSMDKSTITEWGKWNSIDPYPKEWISVINISVNRCTQTYTNHLDFRNGWSYYARLRGLDKVKVHNRPITAGNGETGDEGTRKSEPPTAYLRPFLLVILVFFFLISSNSRMNFQWCRWIYGPFEIGKYVKYLINRT